MTERVWPKCGWTSVACVLVLLHACLGQKDCTGVDCPYLDGCIEEVLQDGACCATCLQRGCVCKGYQFYDCISGGFKSGKVPEGAWYLVDSGSTECRCPAGGGHIRCRFIPCPDVPSHCIELSDSTEACPHCLRLGCVHRNHKYEAGHSFHMDPCQVCHCPNDGGDLMCSVIPDCSSETLRNPEEQEKERRISKHPEDFLQKLSRNSVPIHTEDTAGFENGEDYDYFPEAFPPSSADRQTQNLDKVLREGTREELRETPSTRDDEIPREEEPEDSLSAPTAETDSRSFDKFSSQTETVGRYHQVSPRVTTHSSADISSNHRNLQNSIPELNTISKLQFVSTTTPPVRTRERQAHRQPQTLGRYHQERNHLHLKPHRQRVTSAEVSMCCVAGETWASAHGNCNNMEPIRTEPGSSCWWVQTQCCVSSLRERLCWSGINAARRGGDCGAQHEDLCDSNKECCTCCAVGLRLRAQRESCDPPQGLGVSCSHALLTCCEGTDLTNQSVVRKRTHPQTTNPIRRVSEGPEHQAFSLEELEDTENMVEQVKGLVDLEHVEGLEDKENIVDKVEGLLDTENVKGLEDKKNMVDKVEGLEKKDNLVETAEGLKDKENMVEQVQDLEDVDECSVYAGQLCHHQCVNTQGSYVCVCFPGFVMQPDRIQCLQEVSDDEDGQDKDEVSTTSLKPTETSITSPPERPEPCEVSDDEDGQDKDEVSTTSLKPTETSITSPPERPEPCEGNGHCAQHCHPVDGQAHCSCSPGFTLMPDRLSCEDVDECSLSTHSCELNERCENIEGSFRCLQQVDCPPGYELRNDLCEDVNECALGAHGCGPGFDCINTAGSFSCRATPRCPGGFTLDSQGQCSDVDECRTVTQPCSPGFNCVNTAGSYTCQRKIILCGRGYHSSPDGTRCIDSDECESGVHRCGEAQICQNLPGTYRCDCQPGYQYDMYRRVCVDVNECWRYASAPCAQVCVNTPGSYHCSCNSGFTLSSDGKSCEDVNECLNSPCSHECVNVYGSYQCYCRQGYYLREDTHICEDVDECSQSAEHLCAYKCVNVPGSYECVCPEPGYSMAPNRRSCQDIDECTVGAHNCTADETCYNIHGGFRCLSFSCPNNYRRASDTRCDRISCSNFLECQNSPVRITFYQLSFQINIMVPALVFRMGPSPAYSGDNVIISIASGNQDGYFSPRKLNAYTGAVYLQRQFLHPRDFLLDVEMKLWRQGTFTTFIARIYIFITPNAV